MMMTSKNRLVVRTFCESDVPPLKAMIHRTIAACYPGHYCPEAVRFFIDYHSERAIRDDARAGHTLVLDRAGRVLGTGTLLGDEIKRVFVEPAFQKRGLGRLLMQHLEETAIAEGVATIRLDAALPSKAFYDRQGYVTVKEASILVEGGRWLDYFKMQKAL
jgi:GNAT superfamily N-acetyltransferase